MTWCPIYTRINYKNMYKKNKIIFSFLFSLAFVFAYSQGASASATITNLTPDGNNNFTVPSGYENTVLVCNGFGDLIYNGSAMTKIEMTKTNWGDSDVFYILNPTTGTHQVAGWNDNLSGNARQCYFLSGINQTSPVASYDPRLSEYKGCSYTKSYYDAVANNIIVLTQSGMGYSYGGNLSAVSSSADLVVNNTFWISGYEMTYWSFSKISSGSGTDNFDIALTNRCDYNVTTHGHAVEWNANIAPPSDVVITNPAGSLSVGGFTLTVSGTCQSREGYQTNQLVAGVGNGLLPVLYGGGNCDCFNDVFSCSVIGAKGIQTISVIDSTDTSMLDTLEVDFTGISSPDWLALMPYVFTNIAGSSAPISSPVIYKSNAGFTQSAVPLYFKFSPESIASSTTLRFSIYGLDSEFLTTEYQDYLSNTTLTDSTFTFHINLTASSSKHYISILESVDNEVKKDYITVEWVDASSTNPVNIYDFGNYFPKIKAVLLTKVLFRQAFQFYDGMTLGLAQIDVGQALKVNARMISADKEYNLTFPILDFTTPQILAFAQPIRGVIEGFLIILFGVWLVLRLTRTLNI